MTRCSRLAVVTTENNVDLKKSNQHQIGHICSSNSFRLQQRWCYKQQSIRCRLRKWCINSTDILTREHTCPVTSRLARLFHFKTNVDLSVPISAENKNVHWRAGKLTLWTLNSARAFAHEFYLKVTSKLIRRPNGYTWNNLKWFLLSVVRPLYNAFAIFAARFLYSSLLASPRQILTKRGKIFSTWLIWHSLNFLTFPWLEPLYKPLF